MADWKRVAAVSDIPEGAMKSFEIDQERIMVCRTAARFFVLADECSHDSAPISDGELRGEEVVCTRHGARFSLLDGSATAPPAVVGIDRYEHKIEDDYIYVLFE